MNKKKIGILGGMGPEALSDMYMLICKYYQIEFGAKYDKDFPPMIMYSIPIPDVVESLENEQETLEILIQASKTLQDDGCDFIVIACNSVQFLLDDIRKEINIPIIGIAQTVARDIKPKGYKSVGILATQTTVKKRFYSIELNKVGISVITPDDKEQALVTETIMKQLAGKASDNETKILVGVINSLVEKGAEAILIACTDLPLVVTQKDTQIPIINCTEIYANETARISAS